MRTTIQLNDSWVFTKSWDDTLIKSLANGEHVHVPHAMEELDLHYTDETKLWLISGYQRILKYQDSWKGKRIIVRFEGVMAVGELFLNGTKILEHKGGYTPWEADLTDLLKEGDNLLTLKVDSRERDDVPPFGAQIDYLCYNGIYRDVTLRIVEPVSIENILLSQKNALTQPIITGKVRVYNPNSLKGEQKLQVILQDNGKSIHQEEISGALNGEKHQEIAVEFKVPKDKIVLWDLDNPKLYTLLVKLPSDEASCTFGFREATFKIDGFYLNGSPVKLRGLNRHQSFPFYGYAMPARAQKQDADILKYQLGLNIVRTSHYPQSPYFLERCDKIGLLVFEEIPGWQHIGDIAWQDLSVKNVQDMIERDMNHPSIILWGVRINESQDSHDFYVRTNECARKADPTRQTGGVRYLCKSELLEDVYTVNDFVLDHKNEGLRAPQEVTGLDHDVPYFVTEYNGHMYPTKSFDQEERLVEHARRHYAVLASAAANPKIAGSVGWCAFDYHTHFDFGSGDRICYHGVMDMYRNPKFAAGAYRSQDSTGIFLEPITLWARGERAVGGILPLMVSTNCDYIRAFYGKNDLGLFFPAEGRFPGLKHPPIFVEYRQANGEKPVFQDEWGAQWQDGLIEGFKDGKKVVSYKLAKDPLPATLEVKADDTELLAPKDGSTWDTTRISILAKDQHGRRLNYLQLPVNIVVSGGAKLIGDTMVTLEGGSYAFWIQTTTAQDATISVTSPIFDEQKIVIKIK
ncbi:MAG: glycoside hydrolase family 2 TIM barrel-domain containing protein [Brevinema sp.]